MNKQMTVIHRLVSLVLCMLLVACATPPKIEAGKQAPPKSVMLVDFPDLHHAASIQIFNTRWPQLFFHPGTDGFFAPAAQAPSQADPTGMAGVPKTIHVTVPGPVTNNQLAGLNVAGNVLVGAIAASAAETQKKALGFPAKVREVLKVDTRAEFLKRVSDGLRAKGIAVSQFEASRNSLPRLFWLAKDADGKPLPSGQFVDTPPVDADWLVQLVPVASYISPGPLNAYDRKVGVAIAIFNGRTREFLGWQTVGYEGATDGFSYYRYENLLGDVEKAGPALQDALFSLIPQVVEVAAGR